MKNILFGAVALFTFANANAVDTCRNLTGSYDRNCSIIKEGRHNHQMQYALTESSGVLDIIANENCDSIGLNDPSYNGVFYKVFLKSLNLEGGMLKIKQRFTPVVTSTTIKVGYRLKDKAVNGIYNSKEDTKFSLTKVSDDKFELKYFNKSFSILGSSRFSIQCELIKR